MVLTHGFPSAFHDGIYFFISSIAIGSAVSSSGHAIAYRWRPLPRGRWRRANSPQGSSNSGVPPFQISPWTSFCAPPFSHTHYWYRENICDTVQKVSGQNTTLLDTFFKQTTAQLQKLVLKTHRHPIEWKIVACETPAGPPLRDSSTREYVLGTGNTCQEVSSPL